MFTAKSVFLRRQKEAYAEFSKKAGLLPRIERTGVAKYGRSISARAVWADRKYAHNKDSENILQAPSIIVDKNTKSGYNLSVGDVVANVRSYLESMPKNKCADVLISQLDESAIEKHRLKGTPYSFNKSKGKIYYDPDNPQFYYYDPVIGIIHETSHKADISKYHAAENDSFLQAVLDTIMQTNKTELAKIYNNLSDELINNSYLSDIMSAITENDEQFNLSAGHDNDYWLKPGNRESEIFSNLFVLEATNEKEAIEFLKSNLSILYDSFSEMI